MTSTVEWSPARSFRPLRLEAPRFPPALRRAVDIATRHHPQLAATLAPSLQTLLAARLEHLDDMASWHLSRLTSDGYPCEFTFTTARDGVRCTLEAFPRALAPHARLEQALALLRPHGAVDDELLGAVLDLQRNAPLAYGAWVGGHHTARGVEHKVYAEIPAGKRESATAFAERLLPQPFRTPGRPFRPCMIGLHLQRHAVEIYWEVNGLRPWELATLLAPIELQTKARIVLEQLELAHGKALHQQLPGPVFGCSHAVALSPPAEPQFTFYGLANVLFGNGAATRRRLLRYFEAIDADMSFYAEVSAPLMGQQDRNHHGMFGLTVSEHGPVVACVGLRPPEEAT